MCNLDISNGNVQKDRGDGSSTGIPIRTRDGRKSNPKCSHGNQRKLLRSLLPAAPSRLSLRETLSQALMNP
jgi:hypothetical protein